jgi:hypothetical protein
LFADRTAQRQSVYLTNNTAFDYVSTVAWVTCTAEDNIVYFDIDENTTGLSRFTIVLLKNTDTLKEQKVTVVQLANNLTFDNNITTFDTTLITFDNG